MRVSDMSKAETLFLLRKRQLLEEAVDLRDSLVVLLDKLSDMIDRLDQDTGVPTRIIHSGEMSLEEFAAFMEEYLISKDIDCAIGKFNGRWAHVSRRGEVVGAWDDVETALLRTECNNRCVQEAFPAG